MEGIEKVSIGGKTPLSSALYNLILLARRERLRDRSLRIRAFLITDGKANVPLYGDIKDEIIRLGREIRRSNIELTIYDTRTSEIDPGISYIPLLSEAAGAKVYKV
ncbi:hypothetical protein CF15_03375 [Pyrodictium occultum]|uniref:VWFA domain-containing protein n=1 Tax=Pyrodictium occultum TaxID=2309 RepID=A0A0V8RV01_PYROC|nr:hypothetical protein CF15_03375 [Pyrodictium occultum]